MYCVCKLFTRDCTTYLTQIGINQHSKSFKMHSPQRFMQFGLPFKVCCAFAEILQTARKIMSLSTIPLL